MRAKGPRPRGQSIWNGMKWCYKCKTDKNVECFHKDGTVAGGLSKLCKDCYQSSTRVSNRKKKLKSNVEFFLSRKITQLKHRCKKNNIPFDLTTEHLMELFNAQEGRCYYSRRPLRLDCTQVDKMDALSVDRLSPLLGYVKTNIVLCTLGMNAMKNFRTEEEFRVFLAERVQGFLEYLNRSS
jgi:hypothetical protein